MPPKRKPRGSAKTNDGIEDLSPAPRAKQTRSNVSRTKVLSAPTKEEDSERETNLALEQDGLVLGQLKAEDRKSKQFLVKHSAQVFAAKDQVLSLLREHDQSWYTLTEELATDMDKFQHSSAKGSHVRNEQGPPGHRESHPLYQTMETILALGDNMLERHADIDQGQREFQHASLRDQWVKDLENTRELLLCGQEYGEALAESVIVPDGGSTIADLDGPGLTDNEGMAVEMFRSSRKLSTNGTWGQTARAQIRGFAEVIASIPEVDVAQQ